MSLPEIIQNVLWALNLAARAILIILLFRRKNHRAYPYFTGYLLLTVAQAFLLMSVYRSWGFGAMKSFQIAWLSQGLILVARALAMAELFRRILGHYRGIWALAMRLLLLCALVIVAYSLYVSDWRWVFAILAADRGVELAVAVVIVVLLAFARYYQVPVSRTDRFLAVGFCLYSCCFVINNSIIERLLYKYYSSWNLPLQVASLVSLVIWTNGLWAPALRRTEQPELVEASMYQQLSPEVNLRLRLLNEQLLSFWKPEAHHS